MLNFENLSIIIPAFIIGLIICAMHVPLGIEVLKRGIIFVDLAIAQIASLGVVISRLFFSQHHDTDYIITQAIAFLFAISAAYLFKLTEKYLPKMQEAIIGSSFVIASSIVLILVSTSPQGEKEVEAMLAGQILWINWQQIMITGFIFAILLLLWFSKSIKTKYFYFIFAVAITISVQLVGVYLVFASLILPALGAANYHYKLFTAYLISFLALLFGLIISVITDLPTGPILVCSLAVIAFMFLGFNKKLKIY